MTTWLWEHGRVVRSAHVEYSVQHDSYGRHSRRILIYNQESALYVWPGPTDGAVQ